MIDSTALRLTTSRTARRRLRPSRAGHDVVVAPWAVRPDCTWSGVPSMSRTTSTTAGTERLATSLKAGLTGQVVPGPRRSRLAVRPREGSGGDRAIRGVNNDTTDAAVIRASRKDPAELGTMGEDVAAETFRVAFTDLTDEQIARATDVPIGTAGSLNRAAPSCVPSSRPPQSDEVRCV
jgi:hypothetical protein